MSDESRPTITKGTRPSKPDKAKLDEKGRPLTQKPDKGKKDSPASVSVRLGCLLAFLMLGVGCPKAEEPKSDDAKVEEKAEPESHPPDARTGAEDTTSAPPAEEKKAE